LYYFGRYPKDCDEVDVSELKWLHSRLIKEKKKESEEFEKTTRTKQRRVFHKEFR